METKLFNYSVHSHKKAESWHDILEDIKVLKSIVTKFTLTLTNGLTKEFCIATHLFIKACMKLGRASGYLHLALYLKQCRVLIHKYVANDPSIMAHVLTPAVSTTRSGLPRIIPTFHRHRIRANDPIVIQLYMSLFSLSKLILLAKKIDPCTFESIVFSQADKANTIRFINSIVDDVPRLFTRYIPGLTSIPLNQGIVHDPVWTSVPSRKLIKNSFNNIWNLKFGSGHKIHNVYKDIPTMAALGQESIWFAHMLERTYIQYGCLPPSSSALLVAKFTRYALDPGNSIISSMALKAFVHPFASQHKEKTYATRVLEGPGLPLAYLTDMLSGDGKRRLFVVGNYYTQRLLKPLHDWLMIVLRKLPTDGTFCQDAPLNRLSGLKGPCYSIDLKAATDRMPVYYICELIGGLFGLPFASRTMYGSLALTSMDNRVFPPGERNKLISFHTGQPLGFYASWASFAICHHFLIWYAAEQVYPGKRFHKYAVLGDDVVIVDKRVRDMLEKKCWVKFTVKNM